MHTAVYCDRRQLATALWDVSRLNENLSTALDSSALQVTNTQAQGCLNFDGSII